MQHEAQNPVDQKTAQFMHNHLRVSGIRDPGQLLKQNRQLRPDDPRLFHYCLCTGLFLFLLIFSRPGLRLTLLILSKLLTQWLHKQLLWCCAVALARSNQPFAGGHTQILPARCLVTDSFMMPPVDEALHQNRFIEVSTPIKEEKNPFVFESLLCGALEFIFNGIMIIIRETRQPLKEEDPSSRDQSA